MRKGNIKPKNKNAEHVASYRERQRELGRKKREFYLTDDETGKCADFIKKIREGDH